MQNNGLLGYHYRLGAIILHTLGVQEWLRMPFMNLGFQRASPEFVLVANLGLGCFRLPAAPLCTALSTDSYLLSQQLLAKDSTTAVDLVPQVGYK